MFSMDFLVKEFLFDCRVRSLSEQTILNYKKQLGHLVLSRIMRKKVCRLRLDEVSRQ